MTDDPPNTGLWAELSDRAVIAVSGPDWRGFLQGLLTQDVEALAAGEIRFAALLTPQGRLLFDLFVIGEADGCRLDCAAERREALIQRLSIYRLRAKVEIAPIDVPVLALWNINEAPEGWLADPRLPALGFRGYGVAAPAAKKGSYAHHALSLGTPGPADFGDDATYPIEANFDLLHGIDFKKGCFVGQETTSRMKRRGQIKTRMASIAFDGPSPAAGSELLAGSLRAGEVHSGVDGLAMASLRLDRADGPDRTLPDGRPWRPLWPAWLNRG
jgi:folate-binding protein YgfZ